jgi:hypothetical protein
MKLAKGAPKKGAIIHGALLLVMLVYGYKVWTRDKSVSSSTTGTVPLWDKAESDLVSIEYATTNRTVKLERRGEGAAAYWWGSETKETPATPPAPPKPHPGPMDDPHGAPPKHVNLLPGVPAGFCDRRDDLGLGTNKLEFLRLVGDVTDRQIEFVLQPARRAALGEQEGHETRFEE